MGDRLTHVHKQRLLHLAAFLRKLPPERFDFRSWVGSEWNGQGPVPLRACDTTACALGWACTMPEFKRLGLYLQSHSKSWGDGFLGIPAIKGGEHEFVYHLADREASEVIFGLDASEHEALFIPNEQAGFNYLKELDGDATAQDVAANIEAFVCNN